jgi:hypothetical protein
MPQYKQVKWYMPSANGEIVQGVRLLDSLPNGGGGGSGFRINDPFTTEYTKEPPDTVNIASWQKTTTP